MIKIGIISDIHGNDIALKKVLGKLNNEVDEIISLGDMIGLGPNSDNVLNQVMALDNFYTVLGNHERYYLYGYCDNPMSCVEGTHHKWIKENINKNKNEYIKNIPLEIKREYNGKRFLFLHYARINNDSPKFRVIIKHPSESELLDLFKIHDADYIFYGHEHTASIDKCTLNGKTKYFINPGPLGCPHPDKDITRYGILSIGDEITYQAFEIKYDSTLVVKDMYQKEMPDRDFISRCFYHVTQNNEA